MKSRQEIYLDILYHGLLMIRTAANQGDADQCHAEADHLHGIPCMLKNPDDEFGHEYYWNVMRTGYIRVSKPEYARSYEELWAELEATNQ